MRLLIRQTLRSIFSSVGRFLSVFFIVALGVGFFAGIRETSFDMLYTADSYYDDTLLYDLKITGVSSFPSDLVERLKNLEVVEDIQESFSMDVLEGSEPIRLHSLLDNMNIPRLLEGRMPEREDEVLAQKRYFQVGDTINLTEIYPNTLKNTTLKVVGTIASPLYIGTEKANTTIGNGKIYSYLFLKDENFASVFPNEIYIHVNGARSLDSYSDLYLDKVSAAKEEINALLKEYPGYFSIGDRSSIPSYNSLEGDANRVSRIAKVFPVFFLLVAALVCMNTMTRFIEEERTQIGTMKALGYSNFQIVFGYLLYVFVASVFGSILGILIGCNILPRVIYNIYSFIYYLPPLLVHIKWLEVSIITLLMMGVLLFITYFVSYKMLKENAASLLRPKSPSSGKKILLEHVSFIWKRINFTGKVTLRNLFRYKKRIFMTVLGIAGCTALTLTGFGLRDSIVGIVDLQFSSIQTYSGVFVLRNNLKEIPTDMVEVLNKNGIYDFTLVRQDINKFIYNDERQDVYVVTPSSPDAFKNYVHLRERKKEELSIPLEGAIINEKMATLLGKKVGDVVTIYDNDDKKYDITIAGITENYVYNYLYLSPSYYEKIFNDEIHYNMLFSMNTDQNHDEVCENLLQSGYFYNVSFLEDNISNFQDMVDNLNKIVIVILVASFLLEFIVLYNLTTINIMERVREIATLKVLGFYDKEVSSYVYRETILLTILGILVGEFLGIFLHRFVLQTAEMDFMMFQREIEGISYVYAFLVTLLFSFVVQFVTYFKLKKIDMIESLKSVE